jgi:hypothetical protein
LTLPFESQVGPSFVSFTSFNPFSFIFLFVHVLKQLNQEFVKKRKNNPDFSFHQKHDLLPFVEES